MNGRKPLLILDLDETLVLAEKSMGQRMDFRVGSYGIRFRPCLNEFLATVEPIFLLAVWTSSTLEYAAPIVDAISSRAGVSFKFLWARERCTQRYDPERQAPYWIKDLKKIRRAGYDLRRVLVVDDTSSKLERSYGNHILVREFTGDPADRELEVLAAYLITLAEAPDFRAIEKRGWRSRRDRR